MPAPNFFYCHQKLYHHFSDILTSSTLRHSPPEYVACFRRITSSTLCTIIRFCILVHVVLFNRPSSWIKVLQIQTAALLAIKFPVLYGILRLIAVLREYPILYSFFSQLITVPNVSLYFVKIHFSSILPSTLSLELSFPFTFTTKILYALHIPDSLIHRLSRTAKFRFSAPSVLLYIL